MSITLCNLLCLQVRRRTRRWVRARWCGGWATATGWRGRPTAARNCSGWSPSAGTPSRADVPPSRSSRSSWATSSTTRSEGAASSTWRALRTRCGETLCTGTTDSDTAEVLETLHRNLKTSSVELWSWPSGVEIDNAASTTTDNPYSGEQTNVKESSMAADVQKLFCWWTTKRLNICNNE